MLNCLGGAFIHFQNFEHWLLIFFWCFKTSCITHCNILVLVDNHLYVYMRNSKYHLYDFFKNSYKPKTKGPLTSECSSFILISYKSRRNIFWPGYFASPEPIKAKVSLSDQICLFSVIIVIFNKLVHFYLPCRTTEANSNKVDTKRSVA